MRPGVRVREQSKPNHRSGHALLHFVSCWLRRRIQVGFNLLEIAVCSLWAAGDLGYEREVSSFVLCVWKCLLLTQNLSKKQSNNGHERAVGVARLSNEEMQCCWMQLLRPIKAAERGEVSHVIFPSSIALTILQVTNITVYQRHPQACTGINTLENM